MNTDWTENNLWLETNNDIWPDEFQINIQRPELGTIESDEDSWLELYDTDDEDIEDGEDDENNSINLFWLHPYETDYLGWTEYDYYDSETIILKINKLKNEIFYTYACYEKQTYDPLISQLQTLTKVSNNIDKIFNNNVA